jgi:hypothetical protein
MRRLPHLLAGLCAVALQLAAQPVPSAAPDLASAIHAEEAALARADLAAYRGWLKFLRFEAETAVARHGAANTAAHEKIARLADWTKRISADPALIGRLRGVQEWAYESPVDGSGQPFKLNIPTDYDPARPPGITVTMHGYSGNHLEHSAGAAPHTGAFEVYVLGRARGGWYTGLSRADVLQALDYIEAHWAIDPARVRLAGGSMGGGATFKLGSRYPQRFASGQITCGYDVQEPVANLLTFPIYATHSDDDPTVPILLSRGPLAKLRALGGQVIYDETTGYGHAVWDYQEGNARSAAWAPKQIRPDSRTVRHIDFTALDGDAVRGWWGEIVEWGPAPEPARFVLTAGNANTLFVEPTNIARLRIRVAESPLDRAAALHVVVDGRLPLSVPAPLPDSLVLARGDDGVWAIETQPPALPFRLHTPGGPIQAYNGEPLLIVYGTHGSEAARTTLHTAAVAASESSHPNWVPEGGEAAPDGVPHAHNLYGNLPIKADTAVTDDDLAGHTLVLIGTAAENSVVARIAAKLPVTFDGQTIVCSDGVSLPGAHRTLGLLHYNPFAPQRLVFWVASSDAAGYAAGATVPELGGDLFIGADLLVTDATSGTLTATRSFDSRWRWTPGRADSPLLPAALAAHEPLARAIAGAARRAVGADFGVAGKVSALGHTAIEAGVTRVSDIARLGYGTPVDVVEITGAQLVAFAQAADATGLDDPTFIRFEPAVDATAIEGRRVYRVAVPADQLFPFGRALKPGALPQRRTDVMLDDAVSRFLLVR